MPMQPLNNGSYDGDNGATLQIKDNKLTINTGYMPIEVTFGQNIRLGLVQPEPEWQYEGKIFTSPDNEGIWLKGPFPTGPLPAGEWEATILLRPKKGG